MTSLQLLSALLVSLYPPARGAGGPLGLQIPLAIYERVAPGGMQSAKQLKEYGAKDNQVFVGDILVSGSGLLDRAIEGCDALVIATSAVPKIKPLSLIPVIWGKITKANPAPRPEFTFKADQMPEQIDWEGQKLQIDAAKKAGEWSRSLGTTDAHCSLSPEPR